jgi:hypothetical protein
VLLGLLVHTGAGIGDSQAHIAARRQTANGFPRFSHVRIPRANRQHVPRVA